MARRPASHYHDISKTVVIPLMVLSLKLVELNLSFLLGCLVRKLNDVLTRSLRMTLVQSDPLFANPFEQVEMNRTKVAASLRRSPPYRSTLPRVIPSATWREWETNYGA